MNRRPSCARQFVGPGSRGASERRSGCSGVAGASLAMARHQPEARFDGLDDGVHSLFDELGIRRRRIGGGSTEQRVAVGERSARRYAVTAMSICASATRAYSGGHASVTGHSQDRLILTDGLVRSDRRVVARPQSIGRFVAAGEESSCSKESWPRCACACWSSTMS